jgi:hypothetical protein
MQGAPSQTDCDVLNQKCRVVGRRPKLDLVDMDREVRGKLLYQALKHTLPHIHMRGRTDEEVLEAIKAGTLSFLFDDHGEFIKESWTPV